MADRGELEILVAEDVRELAGVRSLWREYWDSLRLPPGFQNFAEELGSLPGAYAAPLGRLLLARVGGEPAGSAAFRPLSGCKCEAKRLYVRPEYRRRGIGTMLLGRLRVDAQAAGYSEMYADTLPAMASALEMYKEIGFAEVGAYSSHPTPGAIYLRLQL